jgi:hypothetical protein
MPHMPWGTMDSPYDRAPPRLRCMAFAARQPALASARFAGTMLPLPRAAGLYDGSFWGREATQRAIAASLGATPVMQPADTSYHNAMRARYTVLDDDESDENAASSHQRDKAEAAEPGDRRGDYDESLSDHGDWREREYDSRM